MDSKAFLSLWGLTLSPPFTGTHPSGPLKRGDKPPQRHRTGAPSTNFQHTSQETHLPWTANLGAGVCWHHLVAMAAATLLKSHDPMAGQAAHDCHFHHTKVIPWSAARCWQMSLDTGRPTALGQGAPRHGRGKCGPGKPCPTSRLTFAKESTHHKKKA